MGRSAIHPGEHLVEQMEALDMSAAELARGRFGRPKVRKGVGLTSKNVLLSNFGALEQGSVLVAHLQTRRDNRKSPPFSVFSD